MPDLYEFTTLIDTWRYTDGKRDIVFQSNTYEAQPIRRGKWDRSLDDTELKITGPSDLEPFNLFAFFNPSHVLNIKVTNSDTGDVELIGKVVRAEFTTRKKECLLVCTSLANVIRGDLPPCRYSPGCNWALFDNDCTLDRFQFRVQFPIVDAMRPNPRALQHPNVATLPGGSPDFPGVAPDGYWTNGWAENGVERVLIISHIADTVEFMTPFVRETNVTVSLFPGCDKFRQTCIDKFDNEENFGGHPFIPFKNPVLDGF